jgi:colanic acid biosynthesis glycosyl transferase WcaI
VYAAAVARTFRKRLVLWVQDLVLLAAESVGVGTNGARVLSAARVVERGAFRAADAVVVCSPGFRDYLVAAGTDRRRVHTIYNWADTDWIAPRARHLNGGPARFLYAGNLGYTQGFETLIDAARVGGDGIVLEIVGGGNAAEMVERLSRDVPNVRVRPPVAAVDYPDLLASADVHVVLQRRISAGANLPSKIATAMASGRPVLASIDASTPAAAMLRRSSGAVLVEPESPGSLAAAMQRLARDRELRTRLGANARAYAERRLAKHHALERLEAVLLA